MLSSRDVIGNRQRVTDDSASVARLSEKQSAAGCRWVFGGDRREKLAASLGWQDVALLLVQGDCIGESIRSAGEVAVGVEHLREIDQRVRARRDVAAAGIGGDRVARESD